MFIWLCKELVKSIAPEIAPFGVNCTVWLKSLASADDKNGFGPSPVQLLLLIIDVNIPPGVLIK